MLIPLLAVSAVVPSALLVWYFHARDLYPEPPRVLWATFGLGVLSVFPVLAIGIPLQESVDLVANPVSAGVLGALFVAAIPEELAKLSVLLGYTKRHQAFDEPMDGVVYGVVASLGFATLENLLFVFDGGLTVALSRAFTAVPLHAFVGAILGYYVGQARFLPHKQRSLILKGYGIAVLLHACYDFPLMTMAAVDDASTAALLAMFTVVVLLVCWFWAVRLVNRLRRAQRAGIAVTPDLNTDSGEVSFRPAIRQRATAIGLLLGGGVIATMGGMVTLGLLLAFLLDAVSGDHTTDVLVGGSVIGVLPLVLGAWIFIRGVKRLNRRPVPAD